MLAIRCQRWTPGWEDAADHWWYCNVFDPFPFQTSVHLSNMIRIGTVQARKSLAERFLLRPLERNSLKNADMKQSANGTDRSKRRKRDVVLVFSDGLMTRMSPEASNLFISYRNEAILTTSLRRKCNLDETENSPCFCDVLFLFIEYDDLKAVIYFPLLRFLSHYKRDVFEEAGPDFILFAELLGEGDSVLCLQRDVLCKKLYCFLTSVVSLLRWYIWCLVSSGGPGSGWRGK